MLDLSSVALLSSRWEFFSSLNTLISPGKWDQFVLLPTRVHKMLWLLLRHVGYALFEMKLLAGRKKQVTSGTNVSVVFVCLLVLPKLGLLVFVMLLVGLFNHLFVHDI